MFTKFLHIAHIALVIGLHSFDIRLHDCYTLCDRYVVGSFCTIAITGYVYEIVTPNVLVALNYFLWRFSLFLFVFAAESQLRVPVGN